MEYKINQFNLSDINFNDLKSLMNYISFSIPRQKISSIFLGPNLLHFSLGSEKQKKSSEDKKLLSTLSHLISSNRSLSPSQNMFFYSTTHNQSLIFLKRFLHCISYQLNSNSQTEQNDYQSALSSVSLLSYFTTLKDKNSDLISLCDFELRVSIDNKLRYESINMYQIDYHIIQTKPNDVNSISFFYMLLYNLSIEDLNKYLLCENTMKHFFIFTNNNDNDNIDDYAKRYVFVNQFFATKNDVQYNAFAKAKSNAKLIKEEYDFYQKLYSNYIIMRDSVMMSKQNERSIIGIYLGIILLKEYDISNDEIYQMIVSKSKFASTSTTLDLFTFIRNALHSEEIDIDNKDHILNKVAICLNMSVEKILYILIVATGAKNKAKIITSLLELNNNINTFITTLYQISLDKVKNVIDTYNKQRNLVQSTSNKIINIFISRSNLIHEYKFSSLSLKNNPYFTISNNVIDANSYIISSDVCQHAISNYIQEVKNYIYLSNALSISKRSTSPAKNKYNDGFTSSLFKNNFSFDSILNLYENSNNGLIKLIFDSNNSNDPQSTISVFKANFNNYLFKKEICELVEVFNSETQIYQTYIKIKHSFATFLYDLHAIVEKKASMDTIVFKFLEYQPISYRENFFQYNAENSFNVMKRLSRQFCYIAMLIQLNKYNVLTLIDDLKINHIYYFYANFFNYCINIKQIREKLNGTLQKMDDLSYWKTLTKKIRISIVDYYYDNGFIFARNKLSNAFENNKNIASVIYKYNPELFIYLLSEKISTSTFNYFRFAINGVRAFVKLTKIYNEKRVLSNVRNLLTDVIVDNYDVIAEEKEEKNEIKFNSEVLPQIDKLSELVFDFNKESLSTILPKLRSNLAQLKKVWKNYVSDINYLEENKKNFSNQECTQFVIEQRLINFQILIFLFSKHYKFINSESVKKYGVLVTEFTKTVSHEVLNLLNELYIEFQKFLQENHMGIEGLDNINFEKLITKRIELQQITRKNTMKNNEYNHNPNTEDNNDDDEKRKEFNIPTKELMHGKFCNHPSDKEYVIEKEEDTKVLKPELSFKNLRSNNSEKQLPIKDEERKIVLEDIIKSDINSPKSKKPKEPEQNKEIDNNQINKKNDKEEKDYIEGNKITNQDNNALKGGNNKLQNKNSVNVKEKISDKDKRNSKINKGSIRNFNKFINIDSTDNISNIPKTEDKTYTITNQENTDRKKNEEKIPPNKDNKIINPFNQINKNNNENSDLNEPEKKDSNKNIDIHQEDFEQNKEPICSKIIESERKIINSQSKDNINKNNKNESSQEKSLPFKQNNKEAEKVNKNNNKIINTNDISNYIPINAESNSNQAKSDNNSQNDLKKNQKKENRNVLHNNEILPTNSYTNKRISYPSSSSSNQPPKLKLSSSDPYLKAKDNLPFSGRKQPIKDEEVETVPLIFEKLTKNEIRSIVQSFSCPFIPRWRNDYNTNKYYQTDPENEEELILKRPPLIYLRLEKIKRKRIKKDIKRRLSIIKEKPKEKEKIENKPKITNKKDSNETYISKGNNSGRNQKEKIDSNRSKKESIPKYSHRASKQKTLEKKKDDENNNLDIPQQNENEGEESINNYIEEKKVNDSEPTEQNQNEFIESNVEQNIKDEQDKENQVPISSTRSKKSTKRPNTSLPPKAQKQSSTAQIKKKNSFQQVQPEPKTEEKIIIPSLKELDEKISQLKKELSALDIMENLTEQTSLLCFKKEDEEENEKLFTEQAKLSNKEFYDEIEAKLQMAEEAIACHFNQ